MLQRRLSRSGWILAVVVAGFAVQLGSCVGQAAPQGSGKGAAPSTSQDPMTKEQAKELFRSVDEILGFVSSDTKLPIEHSVKRKLISRDEVTRYLKVKLDEDESARRMERSEIALKKVGLLHPTFHLPPFLFTHLPS